MTALIKLRDDLRAALDRGEDGYMIRKAGLVALVGEMPELSESAASGSISADGQMVTVAISTQFTVDLSERAS